MSTQASTTADPLARHSLSAGELTQVLAAERTGEPFLVMRDGNGDLQLVALLPQTRAMTLGRRASMDVAIPWDVEVSGVHAELRRLGEEWTIADEGLSRNGTFLNGERISGRQRLRPGDRLRVGRTIIVYGQHVPEVPGDATVTAGELPEPQRLTDSQRKVLVALCRPYAAGSTFPVAASNQQIAQEVHLSVHAVKTHLRALFQRFGLSELPQNQKRARLAEAALHLGIVSARDLA
jgi:hypothetical protein